MKFKAKPWKTGNSYVVTIPMSYVENKDIDSEKEYNVELTEIVE